MFKDLLPKIRAFLIGTVVLAIAAGVAVVAAGFALYAVLIQVQLSVPAAAGITAVVFAIVAAIAAMVLRGLFSGKGKRGKPAPARNPEAMQTGMDAGAAVIGLVSEMLAARRADQRDKRKSRRGR